MAQKEQKTMKDFNIRFTALATYSNHDMKVRYFATEQAMSDWANAQFRKDEGVTVNVWSGFGFINGSYYRTYTHKAHKHD